MDITDLTVHELMEKISKKELTSEEVTKAYADRINDKEKQVNAFVITLCDDALVEAKEIDKKRNKAIAKFADYCYYKYDKMKIFRTERKEF